MQPVDLFSLSCGFNEHAHVMRKGRYAGGGDEGHITDVTSHVTACYLLYKLNMYIKV